MPHAQDQLKALKRQFAQGFQFRTHQVVNGVHRFTLPALEFEYVVEVPDCPEVREFVESAQFNAARLQQHRIAAALLDIVGFSRQPDEQQLLMLVRYQNLVRQALQGVPVRKMISIGDGTIFIFAEPDIVSVPEYLARIDHELAGFNLDIMGDSPEITWRIGSHVGPAHLFRDINGEENYVGTGVNLAQRVSVCVPNPGDPVPAELNSTIYVTDDAYHAFQEAGAPGDFVFTDAGPKEVKKRPF